MAKDKLLYSQKYRKPGVKIKNECTPVCRHLAAGFVCVEARLLEAGAIERDGKRLEYNDIRVYVEEK